jgi:hypothetical protein
MRKYGMSKNTPWGEVEVKESNKYLVDIMKAKFYVKPAVFKNISLLHKYYVIRRFPLRISATKQLSWLKLP